MAKTELVNPDVKLIGANSTKDSDITKKAQLYYLDEPMVNFDCPYDGTYCRQKHARVQRWCAAVEYNAQNKINQVFLTSADMFHNCPLEAFDVRCIRRLRYENIINQLKHNAK